MGRSSKWSIDAVYGGTATELRRLLLALRLGMVVGCVRRSTEAIGWVYVAMAGNLIPDSRS